MQMNNSFEGGTDGATIPTTSDGSGDAWTAITQNGTATAKYSSTQKRHGSLSAHFSGGSGAGHFSSLHWGPSLGVLDEMWARAYLYVPANMTLAGSSCYFFNTYDHTGGFANQLGWFQNDLIIYQYGSAGFLTGSGGGTIPIAAWFRTEWHIKCSTGVIEQKMWKTDPESSGAPDGSNSLTGQTLTADIDRIDIGTNGTDGTTGFDMYVDDVAISTTGWIGPYVPPTVFTHPVADVSAGLWTPSTGATLYGCIDEVTVDDSDYIQSSLSPSSPDEEKVRLGSVTDPGVGTGHVVHVRYKKNATAGDRIDLTPVLYRADGTTVVKTFATITNIDAITQADLTLTTTEADSIPSADYGTGLVVGCKAVKV